jgi:hypothetical protein
MSTQVGRHRSNEFLDPVEERLSEQSSRIIVIDTPSGVGNTTGMRPTPYRWCWRDAQVERARRNQSASLVGSARTRSARVLASLVAVFGVGGLGLFPTT